MELTSADTGVRHTVAVGEEVRLRLPETPTTGYRWTARSDGDLLEPLEDHFDGAAVPRGAGGVHVFAFRARSAGQVTLTAAEARSWEREPVAEHRWELRIQA